MRTVTAVLIAVAVVAAGPITAGAEASSSNSATIGPVASGQATSQGSASFDPAGIQASASSQTGLPAPGPATNAAQGGPGVTFRPIPSNALPSSEPPQIGTGGTIVTRPGIPVSACPPGQTGFFVLDPQGAVIGIVCAGSTNASTGGPPQSPQQLAEQASAQQQWPNLLVRAAPQTGLTGLASQFWLDGNVQMPDATASAGPLTVSVHASLIDVSWSFGDGGSLRSGTDTGRRFPAASQITHVYQTDTFGRPDGYVINALLSYRVTYSVNGGPATELGVKTRPYTASYAVNQLQPEAVNVP